MLRRSHAYGALLTAALVTLLIAGCPVVDNQTEDASTAEASAEPATPAPSGAPANAGSPSAGDSASSSSADDPGSAPTPTDPPPSPAPTGGGSAGTPPDADAPIASTSASIVALVGGPRSDPERVAPPAAQTTELTWRDSRGRERTLTLGAYLYQYDFTFSDGVDEFERSANDDAWGHEGFGYVVSHNTQNGNSPLGKAMPATKIETEVFTGGHHAIYRVELLYDRDREAGGNGIRIPVVIEWIVATGRDHPIWAVNWKTGEAINPNGVDFDVYRMDTRGPYGSLNFDGAATRNVGDAIGSVAWGDFGLRFATLDAMLTLQSPWVYNLPNRVPFTYASTANANAEMGIVRTLADDRQMGMPDRVYGRERGAASGVPFPNRGDCTGGGDNRAYVMPCVQGWPYQLMNFDWDPSTGKPAAEATGTKLMAWGTPYGYVGASSFDLFDYSGAADGRGDRAYATFIVLGPRGRYGPQPVALDQPGDVALLLPQIESLADARISNVTVGAVVTQVPRGPGSTQMRAIANGYNDIYAAHHLRAAEAGVAFTFTPGAVPLRNPLFVIENYAGRRVPSITLDGVPLSADGTLDAGAYVSLDEAGRRLWVTIHRTLGAATEIRIVP